MNSLPLDETPLRIDLRSILKKRLSPKITRWIPGVAVSCLERLIKQQELNGILERTFPLTGTAFARAALDDLNIKIRVVGSENIPRSGKYVFASNHPLGGLDGIALIAVLGEIYGDEALRFPVNDMLLNVRPLRDIFVGINKYGSMKRQNSKEFNELWASDSQIVFFPAGLVSRKGNDGIVRDLEWKKTFIVKALEYGRGIVPVKFEGLNSGRFYNTARWRKILGLKINIEQILLPGELCAARGAHYLVKIGKSLSPSEIATLGKSPKVIAAAVREMVYAL